MVDPNNPSRKLIVLESKFDPRFAAMSGEFTKSDFVKQAVASVIRGDKDLSKAIDKIFVWAYSLRLKLQAVGLDSVDNFALNQGHSQIQFFKKIKETIKLNDILNLRLETLKENKSSKTENIVEHFKTLKYYE